MVQSLRTSGLGRFLNRSGQNKPRRPRTKAETEKRRRFLVVALIVAAVVTAVSVVGYGYYDTSVKPWRQAILKVNGTTFNMRHFVNLLRVYGWTSSEYAQYAIGIMEDNELNKQYLESQFPDVDMGAVIGDEAANAKITELLGLADNYTQEEYDEAYGGLESNLKSMGLSIGDLKKIYIEPQLISEELARQVGDRDDPATDNYDHARVQALLVSGSDEAALARMRWENGADFNDLVTEEWVSDSVRDTAATDNVTPKWVARGIQSTTFDNYTFNMPVCMLGDPVQDNDSPEDYWLVNLLAREARPLAETDRDTLVSSAVSKWLEEAKVSPENVIVNYLDQEGGAAKLAWAMDHVQVDA